MVKKLLFSIRYLVLTLLVVSFLGACTPKKTSPVNDTLAEQSKAVADADTDDDGAWESENDTSSSRTERLVQNYSRTQEATGSTGELLEKARTALGTPYVRGGTSRNGFDCSGFVQWSYSSVGIQLPRTAREQSQVGTPIRHLDDMQAGDIVAFRHPRRGYHTGIYVGDGKFIHSPRKRNVVRINSLDDPYFNTTFMGARRLNVSNEGDIEAAEQMLLAYAKQPPSPKASSSRSSSKKKYLKPSYRAVGSKKSTGKVVATTSAKNTKAPSKVEKSPSTKNDTNKKATTRTSTNKQKNTTQTAAAKAQNADKKSDRSASSKKSINKVSKTSAKKSVAKTNTSKKSSSSSGDNKKSSVNSKTTTNASKKSPL